MAGQATLDNLQGLYKLSEDRDLRVYPAPGCLMIGSWVLIPRGGLSFVSPQDYATVEFTLDEAGKPTKLTWISGDQKTEMPLVTEGDEPAVTEGEEPAGS